MKRRILILVFCFIPSLLATGSSLQTCVSEILGRDYRMSYSSASDFNEDGPEERIYQAYTELLTRVGSAHISTTELNEMVTKKAYFRLSPSGSAEKSILASGLRELGDFASQTLGNRKPFESRLDQFLKQLLNSKKSHQAKDEESWSKNAILKPAYRLLGSHSSEVTAVTVSPDGKHFLTVSHDDGLRLWSAATLTVEKKLRAIDIDSPLASYWYLAFSPDGKRLLAADQRYGGLRFFSSTRDWEPDWSGMVIQEPRFAALNRPSLVFSADSNYFYVVDNGGTIDNLFRSTIEKFALECADFNQVRCLGESIFGPKRESREFLDVLAVSPDGKWLAVDLNSGQSVAIWSFTEKAWVWEFQNIPVAPYRLAFSPDSRILAGVAPNEVVYLWDMQSRERLGRLVNGTGTFVPSEGSPWFEKSPRVDLEFSPDGEHLATTSGDRSVRIWNTRTRQLLHRLPEHRDAPGSELNRLFIEFSPDGTYLLERFQDERIANVWFVESGEFVQSLSHSAAILSAKFTPDGKYILTGSVDKTARLWAVGEP
jgi:WD40 repeat protein